MSSAVLYMSTSLDGFIAGPDDGIAWAAEPARRRAA
jgi:hypothetical protein